MDYDEIKILVLVGIVLLCMFGTITIVIINTFAEKHACQKLGFESLVDRDYKGCSDADGNIYFMKFTCNWAGYDCSAKPISVGGVRVANG